jgi:high-affinity Fe2+/Pb2+ permease
MNKARILGIIMLIIGAILIYSFDEDGIGFISGVIFGLGVGFLLTGRLSSKSKI